MASFELVPAVFPTRVWDNWVAFADLPPPLNFYSYFITHILCFDKEWIRNFKRLCHKRRVVDGNIMWMVKAEIMPNVIEAYGCSVNASLASDISARRLLVKLLEINPQFFMPRFVIGYPNARGHCFLIAPILLILHSYPIVWAIVKNMDIASGTVNSGEISARKKHLLDEYPFYWIRLFWKIVRNYHKLSVVGRLELDNIPLLRAAIAADSPPCYPADSVAADLQLDRDLINNLCSSLRDFCDDAYGTPGGQSGLTYIDLMSKLSYDIPGFRDRFFLKLRVTYLCRYCPRGPFIDDFYFPVLSLPSSRDFSDVFYDLGEIIKQQDLSCRQIVDGVPCGRVLERFDSASLLNRPEVICFYVQREKKFTPSCVPEEFTITRDGESTVYCLLGSTVCFNCYEDCNGVPYGSFYHEKVDGDKRVSAHVITHLRTRKQFVEINNGSLYHCDRRVFKTTTPGSLHLYQIKTFSSFLSDVMLTEVKPAPYK